MLNVMVINIIIINYVVMFAAWLVGDITLVCVSYTMVAICNLRMGHGSSWGLLKCI